MLGYRESQKRRFKIDHFIDGIGFWWLIGKEKGKSEGLFG